MKHFRIMAMALFAIFAIAAVGAATASAENPEILPNPTSKAPLTFTGTGSKGKLETVGGLTIICSGVSSSGSFTSANLGTGTITFTGCKESKTGAACNTSGDAKEVILTPGDIHLVDYKVGSVLSLGVVVKLTSNLVIKCSLLTDEVKGAAMGALTGITSGTKTKTGTLSYKETKGVQELKKCELDKAFCEGKEYFLEAKLGEKFEQAAEETEVALTFGTETTVDF